MSVAIGRKLEIDCTDEQFDKWTKLAEKKGLTLSDWLVDEIEGETRRRESLHYQCRELDSYKRQLSDDLHDSFGGAMFVVQHEIHDLNALDTEGIFENKYKAICKSLDKLYTSFSDIEDGLKASSVSVGGIVEGLFELVGEYNGLTGKTYLFDIYCDQGKFCSKPEDKIELFIRVVPYDVSHALYLVAREAMTNAGKHSTGDLCRTTLSLNEIEESYVLEMEILDNGRGSKHNYRRGGKGMQSMQTRVESYGGSFNFYVDDSSASVKVSFILPRFEK